MKAAAFACLLCLPLLSSFALAQPSATDTRRIDAVWKVQSFDFVFGGFTTTYSCNSLERRVRAVLTSVGVDSLRISMRDCVDLSGGARMQITLTSPVEATPENIRALATHDSRDQLIARLHNERLATEEDIERFDAMWTDVSMSRAVRPRLEPGDCELLRQIRRDVLPRLSVRVVREDLHCTTGGLVRFTPPRLTVTALVAART